MARKTKPVQEAESQEEDMSEGGEGGEGDQDIWETALDWAPSAGIVLGGALASRSGAKAGAKAWKKVDSLENKIAKLRAKGSNPRVGITDKEHTELLKAERDLELASGRAGQNMAQRYLLQMPLGATAGYMAGSAAKDAAPKRRK